MILWSSPEICFRSFLKSDAASVSWLRYLMSTMINVSLVKVNAPSSPFQARRLGTVAGAGFGLASNGRVKIRTSAMVKTGQKMADGHALTVSLGSAAGLIPD